MEAPEIYERSKSSKEYSNEFIAELISKSSWTAGERILDFGCGTGGIAKSKLVPYANLHESTIDGMDISKVMITYAEEHNSDPLIQYKIANVLDTSNPPYPNSTFDKIFSFFVFHFIKEHKPVLQKLYDILKPGGQLAFTLAAEPYIFNTLITLGKSEKWGKYMEGYEEYICDWANMPPEEVTEWFRRSLTQIGFQIKTLEIRKIPRRNSIQTWLDHLFATNPCIRRFPVESHADLGKDYLEIMKQHGVDTTVEAETFELLYSWMVAVVVKPLN